MGFSISAPGFNGGTITRNGALSSPALLFTGTWITGGSATTTKPLLLIEPTGATSTAWSTAGTGLGINAASGFTGRLLDLQLNGVSQLNVSSGGALTAVGLISTGNAIQAGATFPYAWNGRAKAYSPSDGVINFVSNAETGFRSLVIGPTPPATIGAASAQGQTFSVLQAMELLTIAAAPTTTTTMLVPAGAVVLSISVRVTVIIPTAATFTVSIGASGNFNTVAVPVAATTTDQGTALGAKYIPTAAGITITPNLTPGAATGVVRITATYYLATVATS